MVTYELPLAEVVLDFYDRLKTLSRGYASLDYDLSGYRVSPLVKLDILVNGEPVDALSIIVHHDTRLRPRPRPGREDERADPAADVRGRDPGRHRQQDHRPRDDQGAAQERDRQVLRRRHHRKRKLLEKQKEGKKRMKRVGSVEIPQEAFLAVLKVGTEGGD